MQNFKRVVNLGAKLWLEISYKNGKLSISGVYKPTRSGNAAQCGQCLGLLKEDLDFTFPKEVIEKIYTVWDQWHLNAMRPFCEHQIAIHHWNPRQELKIFKHRLKTEFYMLRKEIKAQMVKEVIKTGKFTATSEQKLILGFPLAIENHLENFETHYYWVDERSTSKAGFVSPNLHPDGLLGKACPTCGYQYGTKWLKQDVPEDVLQFLFELPHNPGHPWPSVYSEQ